MFLGWYDPDKKLETVHKLNEAIAQYIDKFGDHPEICLTSAADAAELDGKTDFPVRAVTFVQRHTYYVGMEETE